jgi:hypothetical protein
VFAPVALALVFVVLFPLWWIGLALRIVRGVRRPPR